MGPEAAAAGSVNTVVLADGRAVGRSTDGDGFLAAVRRAHDGPLGRAVVLGSGGAARAVAMTLASQGAQVVTIGRNAAAGVRMVVHLARHGRRAGLTGISVSLVGRPIIIGRAGRGKRGSAGGAARRRVTAPPSGPPGPMAILAP